MPSLLQIALWVGVGDIIKKIIDSLSVDFSRSGIWGKLGTGVQGICLKSCAKFPPNRTMFPWLCTQTPALEFFIKRGTVGSI